MFPPSVQTLVMGSGIEKIPMGMFDGLVNLTNLTHLSLPSSIKHIGSYAFRGCTQIVDAVIPASVESIGMSPFAKCTSLHKVEYNALNAEDEDYYEIPVSRQYAAGALGYNNVASHTTIPLLSEQLPPYDTIIIGPGVKQITSAMFGQLFDSSVDSTGYNQDIHIVNNSTELRRIGRAAFANMQIKEFDWGDSLKIIESGAFMNCQRLTKIDLPNGIEQLGDFVFANCIYIDSVLLPQSLSTIGLDCFRKSLMTYLYFDCESLETFCFEIPHNAVRCGNTPFGQTVNLTQIDWGPHVRHLGDGLFENAEGLMELTLPEGLVSIGDNCFKMFSSGNYTENTDNSNNDNSDNETNNNPKVIVVGSGYYAGEVSGIWLNKVTLPSTLTYIGEGAFSTGMCRSSYTPEISATPWLFDTVICYATIAPTMSGNAFHSITHSLGHLIIPCGSANSYNDTNNYWHGFSDITERMPHDITLTVNVDTMGTVASACTGTYSNGRPGVRLTATPATQHRFVQWSDGVTVNPRVIYLGSDTAFEAQFAWGLLYTVNAYTSNSTRGSVTGSGTFVQNTVDTLTATSNYGYHFTQWSDGDTTNPRLLTVTSNTTLTAIFQPNQYALEVFSADATQGTVSGGGTYNYNTNHQIHATPTTGYHFDHWNDNLGSTPRTIHLTGDTAFTAFFAINVYTLNVSPANATMGSASADTNRYPHGSIATLTATPNYGYHFTQWSDGDTTNPRLYTMTQNKTLTAQFSINQYSVNLSVDTVRGNVFGGGNYNYLTGITIEATPKYGYHFVSWSDGDTNRLRSLTVTADTTIEALFQPNLYTVNVYCAIPYMGTIFIDSFGTDTSVTLPYLDTVTLTAIPNYGYHFSQWADGDTTNPRQVVVTGNRLIGAFFELNQYTVTLTATHGSVSGSGTYYYNTDITIEAIPDYGYHFSAWSDGNTDNPRDLTMTQDTSLEALFLPNQYTLTLHSADTTLGHTYGSGVYNYLDTVRFGVTDIAPHYHFAYWGDADNVQFSTDSSGLLVIYEDNTFIANFAPDQYTLTLAANNDNYGTVFGSGSYNYGSQITISATPNYGYYFVRWDNGETANPLSFSVLSDTTVTAIFAPELTADLCMVSVENGRNTLIWNGEPTAERYQVFRESSVASQYELLAELDAQESFSWVDNDSWPETRSYRYRLEAVDQYGATFYGAPHKTMHLTINRGQGTNWNLAWTEYEGTYFVTYIIYRGTSPENIEEINRMSVGGNTSYTDVNPPAGDLYYQVGIVPANPCQSYQSKSSDVILSNIANSGSVGISEPESTDNPIRITISLGQIVVEGVEGLEVRVFDVMGRRIPELEIHHSEFKIDVPASGVYIVKIGNLPARKVVVIR